MVESQIMRSLAVHITGMRILLLCDGIAIFPDQVDHVIEDMLMDAEKLLVCSRVQLENVSKC